MATILEFGGKRPNIHPSVFLAPTAVIIGDVTIGEDCSVWFGAVLRGDNEPITIGVNSNVQDGSVMHTDIGFPLTLGKNVTIGHQAMLHGCTIGEGSLIGIGATLMNGSAVGKNCIVGAHALVTEGKQFPDNVVIMGAPAKVVREVTDADREAMRANAERYVKRAARYRAELKARD